MAEEVLEYRSFRKTEGAPILYWRAYRLGHKGGYAGTSVVATTEGVFTAPTEERLKLMAAELGYGVRPATDAERPSRVETEPEMASPAFDQGRP